jgi:hypothetical protein
MHPVFRSSSCALALALFVLSSTAWANASTGLEPGVHVDPGSPAAKEYALPLNQARQTGGKGAIGGGASGALFGAGIKAGSGRPRNPKSRSAGVSRGGTHTSTGGAPGSAKRTVALPSSVLRSEASHGSTQGNGSIVVLLGAGVAILVIGGFVGMVLRRNRPSAPVH